MAELYQTIKRPWNTLRDQFSNAFSSLKASVGLVSDYYGENMILGRGNELSDGIVFTVDGPAVQNGGSPYYWRARVYDEYLRGKWISTIDVTQRVTPTGERLVYPFTQGRREETFTFIPYSALTTIYVPPQPLWFSRPVNVIIARNPDNTVDLAAVQAAGYIRPGEQYQVQSSVSAMTILQLRDVETTYPDWIVNRYLQVPEDLPLRMRELAAQITTGLTTPYDKAQAITNYLRQNIEYETTVPTSPEGQDPIDWFLFDYAQGLL